MKKWFTLSLICLCFGAVWAQSEVQQAFEDGNKHYQQEAYEEALQSWERITEQGYESAALYYNMGNASFKLGLEGRAILYYEKALKLKPGDEETQQNLELVKQKTVDRFETLPQPLFTSAWRALLGALTPSGWGWAAVFFLLFFAAGTLLYYLSARQRLGFIIGAAGLILGLCSTTLSFAANSYNQNHQIAIVMPASSYVKNGPSADAEDSFILHEGARITVLETYSGWSKIKLPDGKVGWLSESDIEGV